MSYYPIRQRCATDSALTWEPTRRFIGTTAALITMAAVEAGTAVASAKIQSNAAKNAAKTQAGGTQQALDFQKQMWGQQQQLMNPYLQAGGAATGLLSSVMRPPGTPGAYRPGMANVPSPFMGPTMSPGGTPPPPGGYPVRPPPTPNQMLPPPPNPWAIPRPQ